MGWVLHEIGCTHTHTHTHIYTHTHTIPSRLTSGEDNYCNIMKKKSQHTHTRTLWHTHCGFKVWDGSLGNTLNTSLGKSSVLNFHGCMMWWRKSFEVGCDNHTHTNSIHYIHTCCIWCTHQLVSNLKTIRFNRIHLSKVIISFFFCVYSNSLRRCHFKGGGHFVAVFDRN